MKDNIIGSITDTLKDRLSNPLFGTFILSWIVCHWRLIFSMIFVDQDKIFQQTGLLKDEYLKQKYLNIHNWSFWFWMLVPFFSTFLIIWILPRLVFIRAHKKSEEYEAQKSIVTLREMRNVEEEKRKLQSQQTENLKLVNERVIEEKKIEEIDPRIGWDKEFDNFSRSRLFPLFKDVITSIYVNNGLIDVGGFTIPTSVLAYSDANELTLRSSPNRIELTQKGKYFTKKYTERDDV